MSCRHLSADIFSTFNEANTLYIILQNFVSVDSCNGEEILKMKLSIAQGIKMQFIIQYNSSLVSL